MNWNYNLILVALVSYLIVSVIFLIVTYRLTRKSGLNGFDIRWKYTSHTYDKDMYSTERKISMVKRDFKAIDNRIWNSIGFFLLLILILLSIQIFLSSPEYEFSYYYSMIIGLGAGIIYSISFFNYNRWINKHQSIFAKELVYSLISFLIVLLICGIIELSNSIFPDLFDGELEALFNKKSAIFWLSFFLCFVLYRFYYLVETLFLINSNNYTFKFNENKTEKSKTIIDDYFDGSASGYDLIVIFPKVNYFMEGINSDLYKFYRQFSIPADDKEKDAKEKVSIESFINHYIDKKGFENKDVNKKKRFFQFTEKFINNIYKHELNFGYNINIAWISIFQSVDTKESITETISSNRRFFKLTIVENNKS